MSASDPIKKTIDEAFNEILKVTKKLKRQKKSKKVKKKEKIVAKPFSN